MSNVGNFHSFFAVRNIFSCNFSDVSQFYVSVAYRNNFLIDSIPRANDGRVYSMQVSTLRLALEKNWISVFNTFEVP